MALLKELLENKSVIAAVNCSSSSSSKRSSMVFDYSVPVTPRTPIARLLSRTRSVPNYRRSLLTRVHPAQPPPPPPLSAAPPAPNPYHNFIN